MPTQTSAEFESILAEVFRKQGWRVRRHPAIGDLHADLIVDAGDKKYIVEVKTASEGRRDRLVPLLSQAILQAQALASHYPEPAGVIAVVGAQHIPISTADHLKRFAQRYAPEVAVGVVDAGGLRSFTGADLERLDAEPARRTVRNIVSSQRLPDLFSDLNQWMLKILLGQHLPDSLISIPRSLIHNASQLAEAANVSVMTASRLVNQLANEGFLNEQNDHLDISRPGELLERWAAANRKMSRDIPARWILRKDEKQLMRSIAEYGSESNRDGQPRAGVRKGKGPKAQPRCCVGLFAAADLLGLGFVRGVPPYIYLERLDSNVLQRFGISIEDTRGRVDVYIRIPSKREAVFRPAVVCDGILVSDILQVWLDASVHPSRGREQANEIRRHVLKPFFAKQR